MQPAGAERPAPPTWPDLEPPVGSSVQMRHDEVDTARPGASTFEIEFQLSGQQPLSVGQVP